MLARLDQEDEPFVATDEEALIAREALAKLKPLAAGKTDIKLQVSKKAADTVVPLPARALGMIVDLLTAVAERTPVSIIPHEAELTTQQAADFLNVSRPFFVGLLDKGEIPHRSGGHASPRADVGSDGLQEEERRRAKGCDCTHGRGVPKNLGFHDFASHCCS